MANKFNRTPCTSVVYLDNNGTTLVCPLSQKINSLWLSCYNPSSDSKIAKPAKQMIEKASDAILAHCGVSSATHTAIFTSGGTESNCFVIRACCKAYKKKLIERGTDLKPHVIVSAVEHHSIMECVKDLIDAGEIDVSYIQPTVFGNILAEDVEKEIRKNTCLISIMYANNEIPVINNITDIGKIAHAHHIPMHSDCVQIFGKYRIDVNRDNIDALSASGHKFYAPKGTGVLILSNALIEGYGLTAEISGTQQHGLRGGTENVAGIASLMTALKWAFIDRKKKNAKLLALRERTIEKLEKHFKFNNLINYIYEDNTVKKPTTEAITESITNPSSKPSKKDTSKKDAAKAANTAAKKSPNSKEDLELVLIGPYPDKKKFLLPNTILLAVCKNRGKPFCNIELKKYLDSRGVIVSIGSACHTNSDKASHVLAAIGAPPVVRRGVLRISFGDYNAAADVDKFISAFREGIKKQCKDLEE